MFSLFFGHNWQEKCNTCVLLLFSARQVSAAQAKKWKEARHSTTHLTLNRQLAKLFMSLCKLAKFGQLEILDRIDKTLMGSSSLNTPGISK